MLYASARGGRGPRWARTSTMRPIFSGQPPTMTQSVPGLSNDIASLLFSRFDDASGTAIWIKSPRPVRWATPMHVHLVAMSLRGLFPHRA